MAPTIGVRAGGEIGAGAEAPFWRARVQDLVKAALVVAGVEAVIMGCCRI